MDDRTHDRKSQDTRLSPIDLNICVVYSGIVPTFIRTPDAERKLDSLTEAARYDVCLSSCSTNVRGSVGRVRDPHDPTERWIYPAHVPGKGRVGILKVLQTNVCTNACTYCALSSACDSVRRVTFQPDELAAVFMRLAERRLVHGIFLSSGIGARPDASMQQMIATVEIIRRRYDFGGYIHLKILPGVSHSVVERAAQLANRLSVNLEAPSSRYLATIAPDKSFGPDLVERMRWAGDIIRGGAQATSQITQFVVGAANETDADILRTADWAYRKFYVFRAYFSAYQPLVDREYRRDDVLLREHRLYQTDYLLRGYGFRLGDIVFDGDGRLPKGVDPKTAYSLMHPERYPVDVNHASESELLKVPGIGPLSAHRIVTQRRQAPLRGLEDLKRVGAVSKRAAHYVQFSGTRDRSALEELQQPWLFETAPPADWHSGLMPSGSACEYPGQTGRRLAYAPPGSKKVVYCR